VINWPQVYEYSVPSWFSSFAPDSNNLVGDRQPAGIPTYRVAPLQGGAFMAFAKDNSWADNLYGALVAPTIKANMLVESWGRPLMAPACDGQYTVNNVLSVTFPGGTVFTETQDHSKWGISTKGSWVCIGDINRMASQTKRGGGTLCFFNADLWNSLKASITTQDQCN
jgi:deoxyribonuclease-2